MTEVVSLPLAGYAFLDGQRHPFSNGVACLKGYALARVRLRRPLPLTEGLARASSFIQAQGRPLSALAACELRSPAPMSVSDFAVFNRHYVDILRANGFSANPPYPAARSNVAPVNEPPPTNTLLAFTYTIAAAADDVHTPSDFLISGRAELIDQPRAVVAEGDSSPLGTEKKAKHVFDQLRGRVEELGCSWTDITGIQIYTQRSIEPIMPLMKRLGLANVGVCLYPAHPPVVPLEFEADVRAVSIERVL